MEPLPQLGSLPGLSLNATDAPRLLPPEEPDLLPVLDLVRARCQTTAHGDFPKWKAAIEALPRPAHPQVAWGDTVSLHDPSAPPDPAVRDALMALHPWRKGPFQLLGHTIDTEWRSDWKFLRLAPHLPELTGKRVLDVGSGNGYFGWRLLDAGAKRVIGIDPFLLYCAQHQLVQHLMRHPGNWVLPLRFDELPPSTYDVVLSMGVLYHRKAPIEHLSRLLQHTQPGGHVFVETLIVEGDTPLYPEGRYANMKNIGCLPTPDGLVAWMNEAGFEHVSCVDITPTTLQEQRRTPWMTFYSLEQALDPADPTRTVEGHPAPLRAIVKAQRPS